MTGPIDQPADEPRPAPVATPRAKAGRGRLDVLLAVAAVVAIGGLSFAVGRLTAPAVSQRAALFGGSGGGALGGGALGGGFPGQNGFGQGQGGAAFGRGGLSAIKGEVVSITADQLTLKLAGGQTVEIPMSAATAFHQESSAAAPDVTAGRQVLVQLTPRTSTSDQNPGGPNASPAAPGAGGTGFRLGSATDVTLLAP